MNKFISEELYKILVCPECKGKLVFHDSKQYLRCENCRIDYHIEDGIPILLPKDI